MNCNYNRMDCCTTFSPDQFRELRHSCWNIKNVFTLALMLIFTISGFSMEKPSTELTDEFGISSITNKLLKTEDNSATCSPGLEHFSAIAETSCGANDGQILHDPHINVGTKLPYYIEYTYNGSTRRHGPYRNNQDYYISGLAAGTYRNLTIIDADGCTNNHGNVTVDRTPEVTIRNQGSCPVQVFLWLEDGDILLDNIAPGASFRQNVEVGQRLRVVNTDPDFRNLLFDEHFTVTSDCAQSFTVNPTFCQPDLLPTRM